MSSILYCQLIPVYPRILDIHLFDSYHYIHTEYTDIDTEKKTLLLLHGYLGSVDDYSRIIAHYSVKYNIIACDLRGHGESDSPVNKSWTINDFSYDIFQVITHLLPEDQKVIIIASSLSTAIALQMAKDYPSYIEKLFLISPTGKFTISKLARLALNLGKLTPNIFAKAIIEIYGLIIPILIIDDETRQHIKDGINRVRKINIAIHRKIFLETLSSWELDENAIVQPVLIVAGENDNIIPFNDSLELNRGLNNSSMFVLPNTKHHILILQTNTLIKILDVWLNQSEAMIHDKIIYTENAFSVNEPIRSAIS